MLNEKEFVDYIQKVVMIRYPSFAAEVANANIMFADDLPIKTAATDGKNIYFDENFVSRLNDEEKLFLCAHEIMHIKFEHMYRLKDKNGKKRDMEVWGIATDAVINANLQRDGFKIIEGGVDRPEAINYSTEEFYEILLKEKEAEQEKNKENRQNQNGQGENGQQGQGEQNQDEQEQNNKNEDENNSNNQNAEQTKQSNGENGQKADNEQTSNGQGKEDENNSQQSENSSSQKSNSQSLNSKNSSAKCGEHAIWEQVEKIRDREQSKENKKLSLEELTKKLIEESNKQRKHNEKNEFDENREERIKKAKDKLRQQNLDHLKNSTGKIEFSNIGEAKPILDWKQLLRREIEKEELVWSQRRSIAENNYRYRLEDFEVQDEAMTEVMIDVSGSVSIDMVRNFLRQLKPLLKESKLKVGCFNEKFWGMQEIKDKKDIDNFSIPRDARGDSAWTEDWDLAVRSFTKKSEINKIVFTDGNPCPGTMPKEDLKNTNVFWIVYDNEHFNPCCGKVIMVDESRLEQIQYNQKEPERTL